MVFLEETLGVSRPDTVRVNGLNGAHSRMDASDDVAF